MSADQQVRLFRSIKETDRARLGYCLDAPTRDQLKLLLSYPPQSAGGLMTTEFVSVPSTWTAAQVRQLHHEVGSAKETVYAIYVLDEKTQRLLQVISPAGSDDGRPTHAGHGDRRSPQAGHHPAAHRPGGRGPPHLQVQPAGHPGGGRRRTTSSASSRLTMSSMPW